MPDNVITTNALTKYFRKKCVLDEVSFTIPKGSVTAILGRNGSGKTTTLRILLGLLEPTRGASTILGHDSQHIPPEARAKIGYLAEGHPVIPWMSVAQLAAFQQSFFPKWNQSIFNAVIDHFALDPKSKSGSLSRGQRAGLALALTLSPEPELLILDDPSLGLDPVARRALLESILYITRNPNRTVLVSSHLLEDIERVADHLIILDRSILRAACPIEEFRNRIVHYQLLFESTPPPLPPIPGLLNTVRMNNTLRLTIANPAPDLEPILRALNPHQLTKEPLNFDEAITAYMSDRKNRGSFLDAITSAA